MSRHAMPLLAALSMQLHSAGCYIMPGAAMNMGTRAVRAKPHPVAMGDADNNLVGPDLRKTTGKSRSAKVLEEAKNEEEIEFEAELLADATAARAPEALEAKREAANAALSALKAAVDADASHPVAAAVAKRGKTKATGKLRKALKKPKGTLALMGEGVIIDTISLGGYDLNDPTYLSGQYREGGGAAMSVRMATGEALSPTSLADTVAEQDSVRGDFPGPLLVVARNDFVDELQVAEAAAYGAKGVVLPLSLNGAEKTATLAAEAAAYGMEAIVRVCNAEELQAATAAGAEIVAIGDCTYEAATDMLEQLPSGTVSIADLPTLDVRGCWKVRDLGFNCLLLGRSLLDVCVRDRVPPTAVIKAVLSKGSVKFGLGMQKGRLEGSREDFGTLAM